MGRAYPVDKYGGLGPALHEGENEAVRKRPSDVSAEVWKALSRTQQRDWWGAENSAALHLARWQDPPSFKRWGG
eukprot:9379258-Alexandrium_andersonii.AAC.1